MTIDSVVKFRSCKPSDVDAAVPLIYSSGPTSFDYVFKGNKHTSHDFLSYAFVTKGGEFSFDNHTALIYNDEFIGIGSSFTATAGKSFLIHDPIKIIKHYKFASIKTMAKGLKVEQVIKLPKGNEIALAHIAIKEDYRGKGFGQKIVEHLMSTNEQAKNQHFVLDVSELNPRAQALYERIGFKVKSLEQSNLKNQYGSVANHFRMEKKGFSP